MYWSSHGPATLQVIKELLDDGRKLRMKSLNNYRAKFGLDRYTDFIDMTRYHWPNNLKNCMDM